MEFQNRNFNLKVDLKYITMIILIIATFGLIATGKLKEPSIVVILSSIIGMVSK